MLNYHISNREEIINLCQKKILDFYLWHLCDENHEYLIFKFYNEIIAAMEYHIDNSYLYIDMMEVVEKYRHKGFGEQVIKIIQKECSKIKCVPIDTSERLFLKCGFQSNNSNIWSWKAGDNLTNA